MSTKQKILQIDAKRIEILSKRSRVLARGFIIGLLPIVIGTANYAVPGFFMGLAMAMIVMMACHWADIGLPYQELKYDARKVLLQEFMARYHPDISYSFSAEKMHVRKLVKSSKLINANEFNEEDVLMGEYKDSSFYLSEIHLRRKSNNSSKTVFKGMIFRFTLPGKSLPRTRIQSNPDLLKRMFSGFLENQEYGFWIESDAISTVSEELQALYPFIRYLAAKDGDLRIRVEGDEVIMLLESDMKFLDDPMPRLTEPFDNPLYHQNIGKQINSLLYILHAFVDNLETKEIEDRLELMHLPELELLKRNPDFGSDEKNT